jgi:GNAT superfamily N-acetyltransferase
MEHWRELALNQDTVPLDPDWDRFYALDVQGILRVLTVRAEGQLVGYVFLLLGPHLHYKSTLWAHCDMFWLDPLYRQGWTGVKMFKALLRGASDMNAKIASVPVKLHFMGGRVIKLLERLGFSKVEILMTQRVT